MAFLDGPTVKPPTVEKGLLDAIAMSPGDDTPKLAYADFLAERGEPGDCKREEFIRLQTARDEHSDSDPRESELLKMQYGLGKGREYQNWKAWTRCTKMNWDWGLEADKPWIHIRPNSNSDNYVFGKNHWKYRKGFVSEVACSWPHWIKFGDTLTTLEPIRTVVLMDLARLIFIDNSAVIIDDPASTVNALSSHWPRIKSWTLLNSISHGRYMNTIVIGPWKMDTFEGGFRAVRND